MSNKLLLTNGWDTCPSCWRVFVNNLEAKDGLLPEKDINGITVRCINKYLKPYHAEYIECDYQEFDYIKFETEADLIVFKLKW